MLAEATPIGKAKRTKLLAAMVDEAEASIVREAAQRARRSQSSWIRVAIEAQLKREGLVWPSSKDLADVA